MSATASKVFAQVGDRVTYTITVTNPGQSDVTDVHVIEIVPTEVDIDGFPPLLPGVDAVQVGSAGGKEDIVWVIDDLAAGESIALKWTGLTVALRDMAAVSSTEAKADGVSSIFDETKVYLGTARSPQTNNPPFQPIVKHRVIFRTPSPDESVSGASSAGAPLPVTGIDPWPFVGAGAALIGGGSLMLLLAAGSRRRISAALFVLLLVAAGCTSGDGDDETQVKGTRIERPTPTPNENQSDDQSDNSGNQNQDRGGRGDGSSNEDDGTVAAPPAPTVPLEPVREVRVVEIGLDDLPIFGVGDVASANGVNYTWDEKSRSILQASSATSLTPNQKVELLTTINESADGLLVTVTLQNITDDERVTIKGLLRHAVSGSGVSATLESSPINVVLDPGGKTTAEFSYLLPSGDYSATASFVSD